MNKIQVKIFDERIKPDDIKYQSEYAGGIDLFALPTVGGAEYGVGTGIGVKIPQGYVGIVVPRSSAGKRGYSLRNTIGVIDSDYRGEIRLLLNRNITEKVRIAQLLIMPCPQFELEFVKEGDTLGKAWNDTERGEGGFGSTGA